MDKGNGLSMALSFLTPLQADKYPHFVELLKELFESKLTADLLTKSKEEEKQAVLNEYNKAENEHNQAKLLHDCVWEIIAESDRNSKEVKALKNAFISAELHESMRLVRPDDNSEDKAMFVFGKQIEVEPFDEDLLPWLHDQLKRKLMEKGTDLLLRMGQDVEGNNNKLLMAKIQQLPSLIDSRLDELSKRKEAFMEKDRLLREQHTKYISTLLDSLAIMENLVEKHLMEVQAEQYATQAQHLAVQCEALLLKIKSLHLEILCETYTKETVPALKKILKDLETSAEQVEGDIQASQARLSRYESVGQDFNDIVQEYGQLRETLKQKKWTLDKLKSYCPS